MRSRRRRASAALGVASCRTVELAVPVPVVALLEPVAIERIAQVMVADLEPARADAVDHLHGIDTAAVDLQVDVRVDHLRARTVLGHVAADADVGDRVSLAYGRRLAAAQSPERAVEQRRLAQPRELEIFIGQ